MAPMVQPPSPANSKGIPLGTTASLVNTAHQLHDFISKIALPKTRTAKTITILIKDLHLTRKLSTAACTLLSEWHKGLQLSNISQQLEDIKAQLDAPNAHTVTPCLPQKHSYAAALITGVQCNSPDAGPCPPQPHNSK